VLPPCRWPRASRWPKSAACPRKCKQEYFKAGEDDIEVNQISPTGYPMRMLKSSPAIGSGIRPNCEAYGYLLDSTGKCAVCRRLQPRGGSTSRRPQGKVIDKTCLCTHMRNFDCWTCGHLTYRLKDTTVREDGRQLPHPQRRTRLQRLPVQHRRARGAARMNAALQPGTRHAAQ
jgi:hypothetical protein